MATITHADELVTKQELHTFYEGILPYLGNEQEQVQSDWNESDSTDPAYIKNKPDLSDVATQTYVNNLLEDYEQIEDLTTDVQGILETELGDYATELGIQTALNNKADKATTLAGYGIVDAATSVQGEKADTAVQSVKIGSTEYKTGTNVTLPEYPSKTSDLTNDSNFITDAFYVHTDNNYTVTDKEKLAGIATGAEVNQNAFSNVKVGNTTISADSKTDTLEFVAGNNITLTPDASGDTVTINAVDTTYESKSAASGGTAVSLVTTGEKYIWNNKSDFSGSYNDLTNKPTLGTAAAKDVPSSGDASTTQVVMGNDTRLTDSRNAKDVYSWAKASTKPSYTASEVGAIATTAKGANGGVAELDSTGKVPSSQLPSFVDDVLEYDSQSSFPTTGESGKIYIAKDTNKTYRWSGTTYVEISPSLALGETSSTAYRGDRGKIAYDHSQSTHARTDATAVAASSTNGNIKINGTETTVYTHPGSGTNPHGTTKSDVGLGNVGNFKAVSTVASQGLSDTEKSNARANIGAGTSNFSGSYNDLTNKPTIPTVNNATLTIQKNGTNVQTFTANQSTNATANITVPTKTSDLTNDSGYTTNTGTVTKVTGGTGLDGGDITTSGTLSVKYGVASGTACEGNDFRLSNARQPLDNILTSQNLNNLYDIGFYSAIAGNTVTNKPSGVDNFGMIIIHDALDANYTQILYDSNEFKSYRRYYKRNEGWSSWTEEKLTDTNTTYSAGSNITLTGTVFSLTKANVTGALGYTPPTTDTNTHRPIQVNGTEILGNNTTALNLKAGSNVSVTNSSGTVTIAATDTTYSSKSAASGGTDVSLVTTGEKYTWNNKSNLTIGTTSTTAAAGNHTHGLTIASDSGTSALNMAANTTYKITAGGSAFIFKTPADGNTDTKVTQTADDSTNSNFEVVFSATADNTTRTEAAKKSSKLKFNPSTGNLQATQLNGVTIGSSPKFTDNDTKNTAGSTDTSSKIFLIGATSQAANPQTYSDNEIYATSGVLTTKSVQVGGTAATIQYNSTNKCIDFVFA